MTLSLRQELDSISETEAMEEFESAMKANDEMSCGINNCTFKVTREQLENELNDDEMLASSVIWDHRYSHVRKYKERKK